MKTIAIDRDIKVFYVTANSFPKSIPETYETLKSRITNMNDDRKFFGISYPNEKGTIVYKAAAEELEAGETEKYGCEPFIIKKGKYICIEIKNHFQDASSIGNAFQKLLAHPDIDPQGYCLEWYLNYTDADVKCMVRLKPGR
jgi:predicted transcriptional regulator YdeE